MQYIHLASGLTIFCNSKTTVEVAQFVQEVYLLHGKPKQDGPPLCPECEQKMHIYGSRITMICHLRFSSRLSAANFKKRRYRCLCCFHIEIESLSFNADGHNITREPSHLKRALLVYRYTTNMEASELTSLGKNTVEEIELQRLKDE